MNEDELKKVATEFLPSFTGINLPKDEVLRALMLYGKEVERRTRHAACDIVASAANSVRFLNQADSQ